MLRKALGKVRKLFGRRKRREKALLPGRYEREVRKGMKDFSGAIEEKHLRLAMMRVYEAAEKLRPEIGSADTEQTRKVMINSAKNALLAGRSPEYVKYMIASTAAIAKSQHEHSSRKRGRSV